MTITEEMSAGEFLDNVGPGGDPWIVAEHEELPGDDDGQVAEPEPAPEPRKKPGPRPNPNSQRQQKLAKKAAPAKKRTPNARASSAPAPAPVDNTYFRGAQTILGWVARPLAMAGLGMQLGAMAMPTQPDGAPTPRARALAKQADALANDSLTIAVYGDQLAAGAASMADSVPWMAQALERAAKISPYAAVIEAGMSVVGQFLCNHGVFPASRMLGTMTPAELRAAAGLDQEE
jgi:hypothetical protein